MNGNQLQTPYFSAQTMAEDKERCDKRNAAVIETERQLREDRKLLGDSWVYTMHNILRVSRSGVPCVVCLCRLGMEPRQGFVIVEISPGRYVYQRVK